jgi:DNA-binding XRE family transcriptional regulator
MARTVFTAKPALRELRELGPRPMTLAQLAKEAGCSRATVHHIEHGARRASPQMSLDIAAALGADRDDLFLPVQARTGKRTDLDRSAD